MQSRITNGILSENYLRNVRSNLSNMKTLQNQLATGKEIQRASDNPYKASRSMQLNTEISYNKQYNENIKDISNWLDTTDTALSQMGNVFGRIETLLVSSGNGGYGQDERNAIQDEIKEKVNELSQILNTSFDGSYIFGGTKTESKPTTVVNGILQYAGNDGKAINITAYKDISGAITTSPGAANILYATPLTPTEKDALIAERDNSTTTQDRKEDITRMLQGVGSIYEVGAAGSGNYTSQPNVNKEITLSATDITGLQKELDGLESLTSPTTTEDNRIKEINSILYNTDPTLTLQNIQDYQKGLKLGPADPSYPTQAQIQQLNSANKALGINQINSKVDVDISEGVKSSYNKTAIDVLEFTDKSGKVINVSELLNNIITDLGTNGDTASLTTTYLKDIQSVTGNLLQKRSEVGTMQNRMDSAKENNENQNYYMTDILSKTEDIDMAEKTMDYSIMQTVYTASLQTSAKILPLTILTYLN